MGQAEKQPYLVALDTCVMMDLADHHGEAWAKFKHLRTKRKATLVLLPIVIQELVAHMEGCVPEKRRISKLALENSRAWGIQPINFIATGHGITEQIVRTLLRKGVVPEYEHNDACFVADPALSGCRLAVTNDAHLTGCSRKLLHEVLDGHDATLIQIEGYTPLQVGSSNG